MKSSLSVHIKNGFVAGWAATSEGERDVVGFYPLGALAVRLGLDPAKWQRAGVPDIPVIYVRADAVHNDMRGQGLETALLVGATRRCLGIVEQMGAAVIVLDVLEDDHFERCWKFYAELCFRPLADPDNPLRVFVTMADVRATLG